jgi:hypothetical protein
MRTTYRRPILLASTTLLVFCFAFHSRAGDYSLDPTSPEVPFTFGVGDVVNHDGVGVNLFAVQLGLKNAFAVNASVIVRPASRRKRVLIPQMNEEANVERRVRDT